MVKQRVQDTQTEQGRALNQAEGDSESPERWLAPSGLGDEPTVLCAWFILTGDSPFLSCPTGGTETLRSRSGVSLCLPIKLCCEVLAGNGALLYGCAVCRVQPRSASCSWDTETVSPACRNISSKGAPGVCNTDWHTWSSMVPSPHHVVQTYYIDSLESYFYMHSVFREGF